MNKKALKLWTSAKSVIPGGNGLISKRPERYPVSDWPIYFDTAKGINITSIDGKTYIDAAQMGVGSGILGYSNKEVDDSVKASIDKGINTTLNCTEEVLLAKKLISLHEFKPSSVKFARSGGEAMAIAIRVARSYTKKEKVAFCGYHGWHDWYLSANLTGDNLSHHLLSGIVPNGVPDSLTNTAVTFLYNDVDGFEKTLINNPDIGVVVIEPTRYYFPSQEFLSKIQSLCKEKGIVIIVDEISTGWRFRDGGAYKAFDFKPDIVVYGKAMGNGYAISAVVGKKEIMEESEKSFVSSSFWTERVGFTAGLKTIDIIIKNKVYDHISHIGKIIGEGWLELSKKHKIDLKITEFTPFITFEYQGNVLDFNSKFTKLMLDRGYLAIPSIYVSYSHDELFVEDYLKNVDEVFNLIK